MTITIGAIALDDNLQLSGADAIPQVVIGTSKTITGRLIIIYSPAPAGHELLLTADSSDGEVKGVFLKSQIDALALVRDAVQTVQLTHPRGTFNVIITGIDVDLVDDVVDPESDAWYHGTIQLLTV